MYEDEDANYNYEKGAFSIIPIKYNDVTKTMIIEDRKGSYEGMLESKVFHVNLIAPCK